MSRILAGTVGFVLGAAAASAVWVPQLRAAGQEQWLTQCFWQGQYQAELGVGEKMPADQRHAHCAAGAAEMMR